MNLKFPTGFWNDSFGTKILSHSLLCFCEHTELLTGSCVSCQCPSWLLEVESSLLRVSYLKFASFHPWEHLGWPVGDTPAYVGAEAQPRGSTRASKCLWYCSLLVLTHIWATEREACLAGIARAVSSQTLHFKEKPSHAVISPNLFSAARQYMSDFLVLI